MEELRIPKRPLRVEIRFASGATSRVEVHLADLGDRPEQLSDLLEDGGGFLPAVDGVSTALLRREGIAVAWIDRSGEREPGDGGITPTELGVEVVLLDGSTVAGRVMYALRPEESRLLDFLNGPERFFAVWTPDRVALVAKQHVARVTQAP